MWITEKQEQETSLFEDTEVEVLDLYEYCHYVNVGSSMRVVMQAMAVNDGGPARPCYPK